MAKALLIIAVVFMTGALLTQSIYAYKMNAVQTLVAEEEPHEEKPTQKNNSKDFKDKYFSTLRVSSSTLPVTAGNGAFYNKLNYCKGFAEKPYTPPDVA